MKKKKLEEILKKLYDVNETEIACMAKVYAFGETTAYKLAKILKKDTSHISRCLKNLLEKGLLAREARCCTHGKRGRYWVYKPIPKSKLKKLLRERAKKFYREILTCIRKL